MRAKKWGEIAGIFTAVCLMAANISFAEEQTVKDAFKNGKLSGEIGSYYEYTNRDAENSDFGWATAYLTLKYETLRWKDLKMGGRVFIHGQLYSDHDDGVTDPFNVDVESEYTLPEFYLNYAYTEKSSVTAGRWEHLKISHIDDAQSEGVYTEIDEISDLKVIIGMMRRFAEIDYDDGEDFGRLNDTQDLDFESTYGSGSGEYLYFLEGKYSKSEMLSVNPYFMFQNDYASVTGIDTKVETKVEDPDLILGAKSSYYHVAADIAGSDDANCYTIAPFVKIDPMYLSIGYAQFSDGNALNKPAWLRDYFLPVDQVATYATAGSEVIFGKLKLTLGDFWTHFTFADSDYETTAGRGDGSQEYELQFGYTVKKNLGFNIRLFDVQYDNVDNRDYQKIETKVSFKF